MMSADAINREAANRCRVLLLEDSATDAELAALHLQKSRHPIEVTFAPGREEFIAHLEQGGFDLVLSDYSLPNFDGMTALQMVRERDADLPFIFVSGVLGEEFAVESLRLGATDYVLKQRLPRLAAVVDRALAEAQVKRQARSAAEQLRESHAALRRNEEALQALNESLERRVDTRTQELAAVNRQLLTQMEERERVETTLRRMQRLEAVGQVTSGVAHDFNNLLTVILGNLDVIANAIDEPTLSHRLDSIRTAAERGAALTSQLLAFSRRQKLEPKAVDLNRTVDNMVELLRSSMGGAVRLDTQLPDDLWPALVDPNQIELVILNLAINARDAMAEAGGGDLMISLTNVALRDGAAWPDAPPPGDYVVVRVADTGSGMTDEVLAKAFEPFFTTKDIGKGSGLGLSQVLGFAKQSGGGVRIDTRLGHGTAVEVFLPRAEAREEAPAPAARNGAPRAANGHDRRPVVLVVDDDAPVREITAAMLEDSGFDVIQAASGPTALHELGNGRAIDIMLIDVAMPSMNGTEVARGARTLKPALPVLFVTGYADLAVLRDIEDFHIIQKPFRSDDIARKVRDALRQAP
jgi:signal transduction histidine kinase